MSLTISDAGVNVQISRETRAPSQLGFGSVLFLDLVSTVTERIHKYTSMAGVAVDYDAASDPYKAALSYFSQVPQPIIFYVGQVAASDLGSPGAFAAGSVDFTGTVAAGDGTVQIQIDGVGYGYFPSVGESEGQVAETIAQSINNSTTHTAKALGAVVTITADTVGLAGNSVVFTDSSSDTGETAVVVQPTGGTDPTAPTPSETMGDALDAMVAIDPNFYCVTAEDGVTDSATEVQEIAAWVEANSRVFFNQTRDSGTLSVNDTSCIAAVLKAAGYLRTATFYSTNTGTYPAVSAFAILATTSYRGTNTLKTLKFKDLPGVTIENLNANDLNAIASHNCSTFYETASIRMLDSGIGAAGYFMDEVVGADALAEEIRVRVFGLLSRVSTKVPYNERGMALLEAQVEAALAQYVTNGFLTTRVDSDGDILVAYEVWHIPVILASPQDKAARIAPDIQFTARVAGAIHSILINGVLTLD